MANVVLTFGSDNSPKVDPSDNVLYRDIDLDVNIEQLYINVKTINGKIDNSNTQSIGSYCFGTFASDIDISPYEISDIVDAIYVIDEDNTDWPLTGDEKVSVGFNWNKNQHNGNLAISFNYIKNSQGQPTKEQYITYSITFQVIGKSKRYSTKQLIDINAVANSLNNIFSWTPGERVLDPEFGTNLRKVLFEGITAQNSELIRAEVRNAISKYEPRIQIQDIYDISTTDDTENNTVQMRIVYSVPTLPGQLFTYDYFALKR